MAGILRLMSDNGLGVERDLTSDELATFLRSEYIHNKEQNDRRDRSRLLHRYFKATGDSEIESFIAEVFTDRTIIAKRQQWVKRAKHNNVISRIVGEKSTVYAEPARRTVADEEGAKRYAELLKACSFDQVAIQVNRWLNLHWTLAVGFRVRDNPRGDREPAIDVVTPDRFWAVCHPADQTMLVALIIEMQHVGPVKSEAKYLVWTDAESFRMTAGGHIMAETWKANPWGRIPYVFVSLDPPTAAPLIPMHVNEDLRSAHEAVWFEGVCMLKESKSATKVPVVAGDTASMGRAQAADSEGSISAPEGTAISVLDMSMDLKMFSDTAETIFDVVASNNGLAPGLRKHQGVQSAEARDLMRIPLSELRREQLVPLRRFEFEFATLMSIICKVDLPEFAFNMEGWKIDFGDYLTPLGRKDSLDVFEKERKLGMTSTPREKIRRNPDLDVDGALAEIAEDIMLETYRIELMKPMMVASGEAQGDSRFQERDEQPPGGADEQP